MLSFAGGVARLPRAELPDGTTVHGDGRWRWPWPPQMAAGLDPYLSSPREQAGVAVAALTLPGVEFTLGDKAKALSSDDLLVSLRFDLPLLDELFANAKAPEPKASPTKKDDGPPPEARPTALDLRRLSDVWLDNARRLARARTEADRVVLKETEVDHKVTEIALWHRTDVAETDGSVRGLVEPYVWKPAAFAFQATAPTQDANLGAYVLGDPHDAGDLYAGSKALEGLEATFAIDDGRLKLDDDGKVEINGFAASSFKVTPDGGPEQLHDARGLSLALEPDLSAASLTTRDLVIRKAPDDQRLSLATLRRPINLAIGANMLEFWFRDLPLQQKNGKLVFDRSGGVETGAGPDPQGIDRNRTAKTLYEWRFYPRVTANELGRFGIPLAGPLVARPLRLAAFEMAADGTPKTLQVLASVGEAQAAARAGEGDAVRAGRRIRVG